MTDREKQNIIDEEHLKLLRIGYIVAGVADLFFSIFPLIYVLIGVTIASSGMPSPSGRVEPNPAFVGMFLVVFGVLLSFFFAVQGVLQLTAARALRQRRSRLLCQIAAGASCLQMPWGVLLGVFTFLVLGRETVQQLFDAAPAKWLPPPARLAASLFENDEATPAEKVRNLQL